MRCIVNLCSVKDLSQEFLNIFIIQMTVSGDLDLDQVEFCLKLSNGSLMFSIQNMSDIPPANGKSYYCYL